MLLSEQDINQRVNAILKCKCAFHRFNFIEQEQGWTDNNDALDPSLFYQDKLHLIQKGNIKPSESIIAAREDANIGEKSLFNEITNKKHNQIMKTCKMAVSFKLNHTDFPPLLNSTVSKPVFPVSSLLSVLLHQGLFPIKLASFCPGNFAPKYLHNPSQSLVFNLARNVKLNSNSNITLIVTLIFRTV